MWSAFVDLLEAMNGTPMDALTWMAGIAVVLVGYGVYKMQHRVIEALRAEVTRLNENAVAECRKETKELRAKIESNTKDFWSRYNGGSDRFRDEIKSINDRLIPVEQDNHLYGLTIKPMFKRAFQKKAENDE